MNIKSILVKRLSDVTKIQSNHLYTCVIGLFFLAHLIKRLNWAKLFTFSSSPEPLGRSIIRGRTYKFCINGIYKVQCFIKQYVIFLKKTISFKKEIFNFMKRYKNYKVDESQILNEVHVIMFIKSIVMIGWSVVVTDVTLSVIK